ncbi:hypothetical protein AACH06_21730 [Ideonella sp. DXS29W]|uniref:Uncharacterized protein n=1 Tax=Ideonella lacteola TaxID=2984193 RepID=A0ABU9BWF2_9BURK
MNTPGRHLWVVALAAAAAGSAAHAAAASRSATETAQAQPTLAERKAAARSTAAHNPYCQDIQPFYWSVGDSSGVKVDGREGVGAPLAQTPLSIASASKMVYGTYAVEQMNGVVSKQAASYLNFTSGYTEFDLCLQNQTVAECQSFHQGPINNGGYVEAHKGKFFYSGGHMQKQAVVIGLGPDDNAALAAHVNGLLGTHFDYSQPQLAGGGVSTAANYGRMLQKIVSGELKMKGLLGTSKVCTNPLTCAKALATPIPTDESWNYSLGHWVEDDPVVGDGAYSSAGAFGFYPWIEAKKRWWGVVARESTDGLNDDDSHRHPGVRSAYCGRQIRAAWMDGVPR